MYIYYTKDGKFTSKRRELIPIENLISTENKPSILWRDKYKEWWINGKRHRKNGPAMIRGSNQEWWFNGKRHRINKPAVIDGGEKEWWKNGKPHRLDGPAVEWANGHKEWWLNGKKHRLNGPAYINGDGTKQWYLNGKLHRVSGHAVEFIYNSNIYLKWYINGRKLKTKEVKAWIKDNNINLKIKAHQVLFMLKFG